MSSTNKRTQVDKINDFLHGNIQTKEVLDSRLLIVSKCTTVKETDHKHCIQIEASTIVV
jgi:hypothetical protein